MNRLGKLVNLDARFTRVRRSRPSAKMICALFASNAYSGNIVIMM